MKIPHKLIYVYCNSYQSPSKTFHAEKLILRFVWESKKTRIPKTILGRKKEKSEGITLLDF